MPVTPKLIAEIRDVSRTLVREWGFLGEDFAGGDLPPSIVHALIEIEACPGITARALGELLRLEKSSVSRLLQKLIQSGYIATETDARDGRSKKLGLSEAGAGRIKAIHAFGNRQVSDALGRLEPSQHRMVADGLRLYADALGRRRDAARPSEIEIVQGYQTGIIARVTDMHARYYSKAVGFGQRFESVVAGGLAAFCDRLQNPRNAIWSAVRDGRIIGSVAVDAEDMGDGVAHLRWFIVDEAVRGGGVGRNLLTTALAFTETHGFTETHLWTFSGLSAAHHLYRAHGFACVEERQGDQWGNIVLEQHFVRKLGAG
ncbi:MAG TPA: helix-turn-helix domain-containing GNAT family N-acetyltransferase [Sphingobium sp.]|uniref:bifunctional helix-turn-helix transcriptional regulator/GNAT family N-acetyltransferase n=1 Tax=Sphingobium sp. TaxID=1912891 RepID=UPI002ED4D1D6